MFFEKKHKQIEWENIIGFRNIAAHEYFAILWQIVWDTAIHDVPELRNKIQAIVADDYQE